MASRPRAGCGVQDHPAESERLERPEASASKKLHAMVQAKIAKLLGFGWAGLSGGLSPLPELAADRLNRFQMPSKPIDRPHDPSIDVFEIQRILSA